MMESDAGGPCVEWAGGGPDHPLPEVGSLKPFVPQVVFDEFGHRPVEEHMPCFLIFPESLFNLLAARRLANPQIAVTSRTQGIAQPAEHGTQRAPALHISWSEVANFRVAALVIFPELNAGAVKPGNEEPVHRGCPLKAALGQVQFRDNQGMQQSCQIGTWGHAHAREGLLYSAGAAYSRATLQHQHPLVRSCQVRRAGQTIVARSDDNHVPPARGQFAD